MTDLTWEVGLRRRIVVNDVGLEAVCYGPSPSEALTLVLLHEGLGCIDLWRDFPQRLAQATGLGVFVWSRAGYGKSDPIPLPRPLDYMSREAKQVLPPLLNLIGLNRGVLLGHSDGATIAAIYAGSVFDPRLRGLILMAPHFVAEPVGLASIKRARTEYEMGRLRQRLAKYHASVDAAFRGWCDAWLDPGFAGWNVADCIDYFRVPCLVVQGEGDAYGTSRQVEEVAHRTPAPVEVEMLADCGHAPHLEQPERTMSAIVDFCCRLERIDRAAKQ